jgi:hypothetical protein
MRWLLCLAVILVVLPAGEAIADPCALQTNGDWDVASNWDCNQVPDAGDAVTLDAGDEVTVDAAAQAGSLAIASGAEITFAIDTTLSVSGATTATAGTVVGVGTLDAQGTFAKSGAGDLLIADGARLVLGGASTLSAGRLCLFQEGPAATTAELVVAGALDVPSTATAPEIGCYAPFNSPLVRVEAGAVLNLDHAAMALGGLFRVDGTLNVLDQRTATCATFCGFQIQAGGAIDVDGTLDCNDAPAASVVVTDGAALTGAGTVDCDVSAQLGSIVRPDAGGLAFAEGVFLPGGTLDVPADREVTADAIEVGVNGALTGDGTVVATVTNDGGFVRPGTSPGMLTIDGDYTQLDDGTLEAEVEPGDHDLLVVTGTATLDGTLRALPSGDLDPALTDTFLVLSAGARSGAFATLDAPELPGQKTFGVAYPEEPAGAELDVHPPPSGPPPTDETPNDPHPATKPPPEQTPPTVVPPPGFLPPAGPTAEELLARRTPGEIAGAVGLPGTKRCQSRRRFTIRLREPAGVDFAKAVLTIGGRRTTARFTNGRWVAVADLRGLRKGRFTLNIVVTTTTGRKLTGVRRYRTCATKKRRGRVHDV